MPTTDTEQAIDLAEQAAQAVRALIHLTRRTGTLADPADTYLLLAALTTLAQRLPQLLTQIDRRLDTDLDPAQLRVDGWAPIPEPPALLDGVSSDLHRASQLADHLGAALDSPQQTIAHLAVADTHRPNEKSEMTEQGVSFRPQPGGQFSAAVDMSAPDRPTVVGTPVCSTSFLSTFATCRFTAALADATRERSR
jgi:hypothetical protein